MMRDYAVIIRKDGKMMRVTEHMSRREAAQEAIVWQDKGYAAWVEEQ